jgi:hypothetical protein
MRRGTLFDVAAIHVRRWITGACVFAALLTPSWTVPASSAVFSPNSLEPARVSWRELSFQAAEGPTSIEARLDLIVLSEQQAAAALISSPEGVALPLSGAQILVLALETQLKRPLLPPTHWHGRVWFTGHDAGALQRMRVGRRDGPNAKIYRYTEHGVYRVRTEPRTEGEADRSPQHWTVRKGSFYPYPKDRGGCPSVSDPALLLYILSVADLPDAGAKKEVCVFNKKALYRLQVQSQGSQRLSVDYGECSPTGWAQRQEDVEAVKVRVRAQPVDEHSEDREEFELLELEGDLELFVDAPSRMPLQVRGRVRDLYWVEFRLVSAVLAKSDAASCPDLPNPE